MAKYSVNRRPCEINTNLYAGNYLAPETRRTDKKEQEGVV
jgi:hypothetical protein